MSRRIRRPSLVALGVILGVFVLLIAAWAVDTTVHSGGAMRNVALDGQVDRRTVAVGPLDGDQRHRGGEPEPVGRHRDADGQPRDDGRGGRPRGRRVGNRSSRRSTRAATARSRSDPFRWFGALFSDRQVHVRYDVDEASLSAAMSQLADANRKDPKEPAILVADDQIVATPGEPGSEPAARRAGLRPRARGPARRRPVQPHHRAARARPDRPSVLGRRCTADRDGSQCARDERPGRARRRGDHHDSTGHAANVDARRSREPTAHSSCSESTPSKRRPT